ncbi:chemotaxis protein CheD [Natrarchaeobaculum sulfurireducens]|uniref:Probable chemoreceptor glutamine deamidase CheD n=1 Tax=Natrarchaeobaculum sulfurireducens TaxID=2044521 RepID=A0A346PC09_9EURY|nr:chemotaxis protein CheD [Natrarchaeobaculum sulfurireducens]AXR77054.1 Chemotaxis protein CheD [Natrarchaeobaculum sulfurireducens]AXR82980.1 Chemotaxis protein CheD [Natrarchaeobaculum sulfurireducens]
MEGNDFEVIPVGVAEYALTTDERPLRTSGVGSCVVVALHDERAGVSGLLHFMLPRAESRSARDPPAKYADTGLEAMLTEFEAAGGKPRRAWAKLAGGAKMLDFDAFDRPIGDRNAEAAQEILEDHHIPLRGTDIGGDVGRMVTFDPATGELVVKTAGGERRRY